MTGKSTAAKKSKFNTIYFSDDDNGDKSLFSRTKMRFIARDIATSVDKEIKDHLKKLG